MMYVVYILTILIGLYAGSIMNLIIYSMPLNMNLYKTSLTCPICNYKFNWYDKIPVVSYVFSGGKCRNCKSKISFKYLLVELLNMSVWLLSAFCFWKSSPIYAISVDLISSVLICIAFINIKTSYIYDTLILLLPIPIVVSIISGYNGAFTRNLIGVIMGSLASLIFLLFFKLLFRKDIIGVGHILLFAALGAFLGFYGMFFALLISIIAALITFVIFKVLKKSLKTSEYSFAPFLVLGALITIFAYKPVVHLIFNISI